MFNIKETILRNYQHEHVRTNRYTNHLFENLSSEFPIEPIQTPWERTHDDSEHLKFEFKFSNREDLKDFVSSIQELEDRMQFFSRLVISKNEVKIICELPPTKVVNDRVKEFLNAVRSIEESING